LWRSGSILPRTILLLVAVLLGTYVASIMPLVGNVQALGLASPPLAEIAPRETVAQAQAGCRGTVRLSMTSLTATPLQARPLDTVTFATTFFNRGVACGPFRATLQLLAAYGGHPRSLSQSGFMLRHDQPLTVYWEWRVGASLPPGIYTVRVQLAVTAAPRRVLAIFTARQRLVILCHGAVG
jgi:hypothetical protein